MYLQRDKLTAHNRRMKQKHVLLLGSLFSPSCCYCVVSCLRVWQWLCASCVRVLSSKTCYAIQYSSIALDATQNTLYCVLSAPWDWYVKNTNYKIIDSRCQLQYTFLRNDLLKHVFLRTCRYPSLSRPLVAAVQRRLTPSTWSSAVTCIDEGDKTFCLPSHPWRPMAQVSRLRSSNAECSRQFQDLK
jgi:hypothetical protein